MVFSAFFWTYASFQLLGGLLVDRWRVTRVYGVVFLVWSAAMAATGLVSGLTSLLFLRLLLGAGESFAYPVLFAHSRRVLPRRTARPRQRLNRRRFETWAGVGRFNRWLNNGNIRLARVLYCRWNHQFHLADPLVPVRASVQHLSRSEKRLRAKPRANFAGALSMGHLHGTYLCSNYGWYFMVFWLPPYLENERHFSHHDMAIFGSVPFWGVAATSLFGGWLSDRLIASGLSPDRVRKTFVAAGLTASTLIVPAMLSRDNRLSLTFLTLGMRQLRLLRLETFGRLHKL